MELILWSLLRRSSDRLHRCALAGIHATGGEVVECGVVTTPLLHYRVCTTNDGGSYGTPSNEGYTSKLLSAFNKLQTECKAPIGNYSNQLLFDGANGVGGVQLSAMMSSLRDVLGVTLYNDGSEGGVLNHLCGADHVKTGQCWPTGEFSLLQECHNSKLLSFQET